MRRQRDRGPPRRRGGARRGADDSVRLLEARSYGAMSMLTEQEYEEYIRLLRAWVDAEKALEGPDAPDAEAAHHAREAYTAVQTFRERHGLGGAARTGG